MKYANKQSRYLKTKEKLLRDHDGACSGCGMYKPSEGSHRIPRSLCIGSSLEPLYWDPNNIDLFCRDCHNKMNQPAMLELNNFAEILAYYEKISLTTVAGNMYIRPLYQRTKLYAKGL